MLIFSKSRELINIDNVERIYVVKNKIMVHLVSGIDIIFGEYENENQAQDNLDEIYHTERVEKYNVQI